MLENTKGTIKMDNPEKLATQGQQDKEKQNKNTTQHNMCWTPLYAEGQSGSMSQVVGLLNNSHKPITNTAWVRTRLCKLQKRCTRLAAASDEVYQLLAHGRWFSPGTPASSTTKTGCHDIAESGTKHRKTNKNHYMQTNTNNWR